MTDPLPAATHIPVMPDEVIDALAPRAGSSHVDATLGVGRIGKGQPVQPVEPVQTAWRNDEVPLQDYPAGNTGPESWSAGAR